MKPRVFASVLGLFAISNSYSTTIYWDGSGTGWNAASAWSTGSGATIPDPATVPGSGDLATFNTSVLNTAQTVNLNAAQSASGLSIVSTGSVAIQAGGTNQTLTLGTSGINKTSAASSNVTIGSATTGQQVALALSGSQTWQNNNSTGIISILNGVAPATAASYTLTLGGTNTAGNLISGGVIANNSTGILSLSKIDAGTWILGNTTTATNNTFTGNVSITGGKLRVMNPIAVATLTTLGSGNTVSVTGATLEFATASTANAITYANNLSLNGGIIYYEDGNTTLTGAVSLAGSNTINGRYSTKNLTLSGVISGTGGITKTNTTDLGAVDLLLSGSNTFTSAATGGVLTVNLGYVRLGNANALGYTPTILVANQNSATTTGIKLYNGITIGSGRTLILRNGNDLGNGQRTALENLSGDNTWAGSIVLESPVTGVRNQTLTSTAGTLTIAGNIYNSTTLPSAGMFVRGNGNGVINGTMTLGDGLFLKTDGGTWTINSTGNTQSATTVAVGSLVLNNTSALQAGKPLTLGQGDASSVTLSINSGFSQNFSTITTVAGGSGAHTIGGAGSLDTSAAGIALTVNDTSAADDLTISSPIIGSGTLNKAGLGTLFLNGNTITAPVTLSTGTLRGNPTFSGGLAVATGTTLVPGNTTTAGTLNANTLAFSGTNTLAVNVGDAGSDVINVTAPGGLTQAGTTTIQVTPNGSINTASTFYPIISYTGTSPGTAGFTIGSLPGRVAATVTDNGSAIGITATNDRIVWSGTTDANWDGATTNWVKLSDSSATTFLAQDDVIFNDLGIAQNSIALVGTINPSRVEFAQTSGTYSLASGTLTGSGSLYQTGAGKTVLLNTNTYTGSTNINTGTLELDNDTGTLTGTSIVNVGSSGTFRLSKDDGDITFARSISGSGIVTVNPHSLLTGTTAARSVILTGANSGFSGSLNLESPLIGSARMLTTPPSAVGTASITVSDENQFYGNGSTYTNNIALTGNGYNDASGSIGALRMDGGTWNGNISITGTAGNSSGTTYDARIGGNGGTDTINGTISGGDVSFWTYTTSSTSFVVTAANTYGDTIIGGADNTSASAGTLTYTLGDTLGTPANTTATFGTGKVYMVTGNNATNPMAVNLRIRRADGYTLPNDIIGTSSNSATLGRLTVQADTIGAGLSLNGKTLDLSDGTNGGQLRVAASNTGATLNITSGSTVDLGTFYMGDASGFSATTNQSGGTTSVINQLRVGHYPSETSTYNLSAGTVSITAANGATNPFTTGNTEQNGGIYIGIDGTGVFNQLGGTVNTNWVVLDNRGDTAGADQYNLTGGTLNIKNSWGISGNASGTLTLGGGSLVANNVSPIDVPVSVATTVSGTGSILDTLNTSNTITFSKDISGAGTVTTQGGGAIRLNTATTQGVSAIIAGTNPVVKQGVGTTTLSATNTYTGATSVNAGRLDITGSAANSAVSLANGTSIGGEGSVASLTLGATATDTTNLYIDASTSGALTSSGALTINGPATAAVNVNVANPPSSPATVVVLNYSGGTPPTAAQFSLVNAANYRTSTFTVNPTNVTLDFTNKNLVWDGSTATWEIGGSDNDWNDTSNDNFFTGDKVTFDDSLVTSDQTITMVGAIAPGSVTVNNTTYKYAITGSGIGGSGSLTKSGDFDLDLGGTNTFTGGVSITGGILKMTSATALGSGSAGVSINGGTLDLGAISADTINLGSKVVTITGTGVSSIGAITQSGSNTQKNAFQFVTLANDATIGGTGRYDIRGTSSVLDLASHTLTKIGSNTVYGTVDGTITPGNVEVNAGTFAVWNGTVQGAGVLKANTGGTVEISSIALGKFTRQITLNGGSLSSVSAATTTGDVLIASTPSSSSSNFTNTADLYISGALKEDTGPFDLVKINAGTLILNGTNELTGKVNVSTGILRVTADSLLGPVPGSPVADSITLQSGGRIQGGGTTGNDLTINANRGIYLPNGDGGMQVWTGFTMNYAGAVTGTGNFTKSDGGILNYTGTASHTGSTNVNAGTMNLTGATITANNNINISGSSTVNVNTGTTWTTAGSLSIQTATLNITGGSLSANRFITNNASNTSTTINQSGGTVSVTGTNSNNDNTASFLFGHWGSSNTSTYNLTGGTLNSLAAELSFGWDSTNALFYLSGGSANLLGLDLGNSRNYSATFSLTGGRLNLGANGITNNGNKTLMFGSGTVGAYADWASAQATSMTGITVPTTFDTLDSADTTTARTITLNGVLSGAGGLKKINSGNLVLKATNTYTGNTTVNGGTLSLSGGGGANGTIRGSLAMNSGTVLQINTGDATGYDATTRLATINLVGAQMNVAVTSNQTLGNGTINMTGASITGVAGSNIDFFQTSSALNSLASSTTSTITDTKLSIRQTAGVTLTVAQGTTASGIDLDISSVITNNGSFAAAPLIKAGAGTLRLTAANTTTGAVNVNAGKLLVNNTTGSGTGSGAVTVAAGATVGGNGTLAGATTVSGTLAPGNSVGTLNFGSTVDLQAGSTYAVEITGAASNDKVIATGALTANGSIAVTLSGYAPIAGDIFDIADASSITGVPTFNFTAAALTAGLAWDTSSFTTDGTIKVISTDPYIAWATLHGVTGGKAGDDDGDGVSNLLEFATNADPQSGSSGARAYGKMFTLGADNVLTYTVAVRKSATFAANGSKMEATKDKVKYSVEATNELATWSSVVVTELGSTDSANVQAAFAPALPTLEADWEWHTFRTDDGTSIDPQDFIRLKVEEVP